MDNLLVLLFAALPFIAVAVLALLAVAGVGVGLVWPRVPAYGYLALLFCTNSTSYGALATTSSPGIYSRGSGQLLFPVLLWCMAGAWCCTRGAAGFRRQPVPPCSLRPWFLGWGALLGGHVAVAAFTGVTLAQALAPSGFSNVVWMAPLVGLLLLSFGTREHALELARFILLAGCGRALFGLARWAFLGGDPNNVYANMNDINVKLTFFDINDSLLGTVACAIAAINLLRAGAARPAPFWRALDWVTLGTTAACIVLSYRRTAWIGFVLALAVVALRCSPRRRIALLLLGAPVVGAGLVAAAVRRLGHTHGAGGGLSSLFYDMASTRTGAQSERVLELHYALADFLAHPLTGIGAWGRYAGYRQIAWQAGEDGGLFLHSGVLHIALKAGLPGLVLLGGTIWAFTRAARQAGRTLPPDLLALATAGAAGLAFMLPDLLVGTPFPQVRTTQMLAVCLALPYVALAAARARSTDEQTTHEQATHEQPARKQTVHGRPMRPVAAARLCDHAAGEQP